MDGAFRDPTIWIKTEDVKEKRRTGFKKRRTSHVIRIFDSQVYGDSQVYELRRVYYDQESIK